MFAASGTPDYSFSTISYDELRQLANVVEVVDDERFEPLWQGRENRIDDKVQERLNAIILRNRRDVDSYTEEEVKLRIVSPLLMVIDFPAVGCEEWWERSIEARFPGGTLGGKADLMLAPGEKAPRDPI